VSLDPAALSSIASSLEDLTRRLSDMSDRLDEEDEFGLEMLEVERLLQGAGRRLNRVARRLG